MKKLFDYLVYLAVRCVFCLLQTLPARECLLLAEPLIRLVTDILKVRRDVIDENLRHAFPSLSPTERRALRRQHWRHLLLMVHEIANAERKIHLTNWRDHVSFRNKQQLVSTL
ncbi:MAG: lipid A biosynthesis acyltransferase, partial [Planctomycetota bacterium]|nr:lipid A biosynthesis acyltransferase [Planctomycetota bacterium]